MTPVQASLASPAASLPSPSAIEGALHAVETKGRILIVDDEVNARTALVELLRDEGYVAESAADAFKALGKMADFAPDLVLTDLKMPGMDGLQLLARLLEDDPQLPVVVMTAFGEVETAVRAMRSGARDYLAKPVNVGELQVVVAREMEQRGADAGRVQDRGAGGRFARQHPGDGRVRHRQGADRRRDP